MPEGAAAARGPGGLARRVVITGMGAVSALGWGVAPLAAALRSGRTGIGPFTRFDHSRHRTHVAGQVPDPPRGLGLPRGFSRLSLSEQFAVFAAIEALEDAGLPPSLAAADAGVFFGTSTGGLLESERFLDRVWAVGMETANGLGLMAGHQLNAPGDAVARHVQVTGPVETISSACASAAMAIVAAARSLQDGDVLVAITGGADCLSATTYAGFNSLRSVDGRPCRPFRADRGGLSLGEGGAVLVLETAEHAVARGARVRAELLGGGASCDASHMTAPQPEGTGPARALLAALGDAGIAPESVGFIDAHGTGTPLNDASESAAFARVFGDRTRSIPVSATKSVVGHLLGSSGAIEAVATVLCLEAEAAHPTAGTGPADEALGVDLVEGGPRPIARETAAVSTSLGFGGANAAIVFGRQGQGAG